MMRPERHSVTGATIYSAAAASTHHMQWRTKRPGVYLRRTEVRIESMMNETTR